MPIASTVVTLPRMNWPTELNTLLGIALCGGIIAAYFLQRRWLRNAWLEGIEAHRRNDFEAVHRLFTYIVKKQPGWAAARRMLARGLAGTGAVAEAEREFRFAVELEPANAENYLDLAVFLANLPANRHKEAVDCLETAVVLSPELGGQLAKIPQLRALHTDPRFQSLAGISAPECDLARLN